ncbi:SCO family protein [Mesobacillus maritimus]|uniref:SCO family protein n=1 Tax=Mesobacillus maritimus TaxID=1643336 RepID=UPI002040E5B2|nr:SCO family protein [Mesobacillus maritimus]MCM3588657.1 SCO family protein [Mesobacillus maritimus]MCM3671820.1 SCO family protein [Mesobacillus maritimus]
MKKRVLTVTIIMALFLLSACGQKLEGALDWPIEEFKFTNHSGETYSLNDLDGKVWVADFIFTNCADVCPPMTANMKKLQDMVKEEGLENVEFVSFTVDPEVDTPEVLKAYGEQFHVDFSNWNFLTGYGQKDIETFAMDNFKTIVVKPEEGDQVVHQTYFYLVDQDGKIQKQYSGLNDIPFEEIISDIKTIQ